VHGNVVPPKLDADADDVEARVTITENRLAVELARARVTAREPRGPGQVGDAHGMATGGLTVPLAGAVTVAMHWDFDGEAAGIPLKAHVGHEGDELDA
jgi:hypothetical protein